jgi:hypothetical protein
MMAVRGLGRCRPPQYDDHAAQLHPLETGAGGAHHRDDSFMVGGAGGCRGPLLRAGPSSSKLDSMAGDPRRPAPSSSASDSMTSSFARRSTTAIVPLRASPPPSQCCRDARSSTRRDAQPSHRWSDRRQCGRRPSGGLETNAIVRSGAECNRPQRSAFLRVAAVVGTIDVAAPRLIWRAVCQGLRHEFPAFAGRGSGVLGWVGGGPACCGRRRRNSPSVTTPPGSGQLDSAPTRRYRCGCS